ncbi:FTR1 family iron permease [Cognatazoarcus halotolerans]|uniref:FTR1 family iron permease n=1 Tax=Cognatazoarcus halotolerans TaxID=2686016 RepID=UPI0013593EC5|nr:FTR1 family protein [Cognatazoarcus halotolerans]MCB1900897.1 FTR1 family protein [Rhodocyclaceae bacterium]MCP5308658.1 FTR1 family protein [Zoogloeaceae bacterium]
MLGAAIIVFRESLEAALLIGIIAAAARSLPGRNRWLAAGVAAGVAGAFVVAAFTSTIGELADGVGQELLTAGILGLAVVMLAWHNIWMSQHARQMITDARSVVQDVADGKRELSAIALVIALAVLREGAETVLFLYGIASQGETTGQVLAGGALGLGAGALVGAALYMGLLRIPVRWFFSVTAVMVLLIAAGMAGQMARFLIQGDIIPAIASPIWDTSRLIPDGSALGTLLHVLAGYDARPSAMQALFYISALAIIVIGMRLARQRPARLGAA